MNAHAKVKIGHSVCPHDCPSTCALDVELLDDNRIGRVHGAKDNAYTAGVICAKVARYAERIHHPDRLMHPLRRKGPKGSGQFERISWDDALDITAEAMLAAERRYGPEAVWPYYYAGTMGLVMRDGINRLRHAKRYSVMYATICTTTAWTGYIAGTGKLAGPDPREMAKSDMVVIWGTNPVNTQVNVMTHATRARKERGAKIVAVDIYHNGTMQQADLALCLRPGTDGALACAVMHVLFRDGHANWPYMEQYTDCPRELEAHLRDKTPEWASAITGLTVAEIETFAKMVGTTPKTYFRLGYGFSRQRNGAHNMHAALCIPSVTGAWLHEGGGGFHNNGAIYHWNKSLIEGLDVADPTVRVLDQCRIGPILTGDQDDLKGGAAGHGALHPEHEPGAGRARAAQGEGRLRARGPVRVRARAVHDGDGKDGRCGAAGHHVPGARRRLSGRRAPIHHAGPEAARARRASAGPTTTSSAAWPSASAPSIRALPRARARSSTGRCRSPAGARWPSWKRTSGSTASRSSTRRTTSTASATPTRSSASSPTGRTCRRRAATASASSARCRACRIIGT